MSVGNKKKDRDNQGSSTSSGGEASASYMIGKAGEGGRRDTGGGEATANKVTNTQEGITTQKEKVTSASSSSQQNQTPSQERTTTTTAATSEVPHYQYQQHQQQQQREQQQSLNRALDQTRDNIKRSTDEARKEIPRYTQAVNDYQEQTIQAAREIADNYIDSQRQIINSLQSAWVPQIEEANKVFTSNWISPRYLIEIYANMVSNFADNMIAATRLVNNIIFANMDAFKTSIQQAKDNAKELSRIGVNSARTFEQTSRDTTATPRIGSENTSSTTARVYVEREQEERDQRRS
ncbi:MAG TPA: hypothetical protein VFI70_06075 [Nitrososphaeraceae archaeon]|nr:hypothetical protein [Nitrososphaeraceae archaeon]